MALHSLQPSSKHSPIAARATLAIPDFTNYLPGLVLDDSSGAVTDKVLERIQTIAAINV